MNDIPISRGLCRVPAMIAALMLAVSLPAHALDYQVHGSAAQGFAWSDDNNAYGTSQNGSFEFFEVGLNGSVQLAPGLLASGQLLMRDAGANDNGSLRVDYGLLDYQIDTTGLYNFGARIGRVKNPLGLYNDTRDVVFARPGIQLPQSIYFDGQGLRSLLFASDGGQIYGGVNVGDHYLSTVLSAGRDQTLSAAEERQLTGGTELPATVQLSNFYLGRVQDEWNAGTDRLALSALHANLDVRPDPGVPISGHGSVEFFILSFRHDAARYSVSSEYMLTRSNIATSFAGTSKNLADGFYVQADYHLDSHWSLMSRYDASFVDRNDRSGHRYAKETGGDPHTRYARDLMLGARWLPDEHWGAWAEWHHIVGSSTVPALDNLGQPTATNWNLVLLMLGYRF